jgi:hypothetical protein
MDCYFIGFGALACLRRVATETERAAIERLGDFRGTVDDMRLAVGIAERAGDRTLAEHLRRELPGSGWATAPRAESKER